MSFLVSLYQQLTRIPGFQKFYLWLKQKIYGKTPPASFISLPPSSESRELMIRSEPFSFCIHSVTDVTIDKRIITSLLDPVIEQGNDQLRKEVEYSIVDNGFQVEYEEFVLTIELATQGHWDRIHITHNLPYQFGLGEKNGSMNKQGRTWRMWNSDNAEFGLDDDPLYKSYPIGIMTNQDVWVAIILDQPGYQEWDLSDKNTSVIYSLGTNWELQLVFGDSPHGLMKKIAGFVGTMELPPIWSLGYHQCRWSYVPADRVREIADGFRSNDIPCDALYLDIDYMDDFKCFTWDETGFGDLPKLVEDLHAEGFKVVSMIDPGIKVDPLYDIYNQGHEQGYFVKNGGKEYHGPVWPGECAFPDFFNESVVSWWGGLYSELVEIGIDGFWNDMNEPSIFTMRGTMPDLVIHDITDHSVDHKWVHNRYGQMMARASYNGLKHLRPNLRQFLLSRSAYIGSQLFGWIWTGDNKSSYDQFAMSIPKLLNTGLSGHFANGVDIGGFRGECTAELYARWIQLGVFYPFMRTHTREKSPPQEPWSFGEEVLAIARRYIRLRYELLPYIYTWFWYGCNTGIPLLRPLWMEFPTDDNCYDDQWMNTEFMFGPDLLIIPILSEDSISREAYIPEGRWYSYFDQTNYEGGSVHRFDIPLDSIVVLVRENSIIPIYESPTTNVEETMKSEIIYKKFGEDPSGFIYKDDGKSFDYINNQYGYYKIHSDETLELLEGSGF